MGRRKTFVGEVVSAKMQKTVVVKVTRMTKDAKYGRIYKRVIKFKVHDEKGQAHVGDAVKIEETRPLSKDKRFTLHSIMKKAAAPHIEIKDEVK
jgi:small subunit ribosomal protein S17